MTEITNESLISWDDFEKVDIRLGTVVAAEEFPKARKPAYKLQVDFGSEIGILKSSAQITDHYTPEGLVGKRVMGVVNFPKKQIGPIRSECLVVGFHNTEGAVTLATIDDSQPSPKNGAKLA